MILSDTKILKALRKGHIIIEPFDVSNLGGNSYDVHLGPHILTYNMWRDARDLQEPLDCKVKPKLATGKTEIPLEGIVLRPGRLYLASTVEYTESHKHVPYLDGKSSVGRLGISIHQTAGRGDVGFCGHWTMEITVVQEIRVYADMPIGQLTWHKVCGEVERTYGKKKSAKYNDGRNPMPQPSRMHLNWPRNG